MEEKLYQSRAPRIRVVLEFYYTPGCHCQQDQSWQAAGQAKTAQERVEA